MTEYGEIVRAVIHTGPIVILIHGAIEAPVHRFSTPQRERTTSLRRFPESRVLCK